MIKAVIFDMDGTIIDSEPIYERVNEEIYEKYGFNLSQEDYDRHMGANLKDIWTDILDRYQVKDEYSHYKIEDFMEDHIHSSYMGLAEAEDLELMPGVKDWFEFLKDHGYKMIVASSSYEPVIEHVFQRFGLENYMEGYVDGNAIENGKPAPDIFLEAAERLGVKPEECIVIEDSEHGVNGAHKAGARVIGFNRAKDESQDLSRADLIIDEFNQENLNEILK
ncbi:HAD superfamily hydrolase (TIGR01509 family)/HAD superfamily hydrolase (TIGR01549 family) [Halanaerobium saccharolyticum]|uniref:HAD superfamily hydrolase (TIGR01509 family)/HAD superfamily hydrolase (TIGR01549 family) n=1 Tax=Halanaerobium saccharolyticum TaxID=43595 RepID=A0A4R6SKZ8_9FIRM|nr:HAD family phosphatase [Halanaerobium saccharolyticum]TDQ01738.1 HAD superfamily hydrolase (TIGR01509 family)/HAD superfamily hydrolase (TIGR01549 family) [Halanaerobium saccharolyticum]